MTSILIVIGVLVVAFFTYLIISYYKMKNTPEPKNSKEIKQVTNKNLRVLTMRGTVIVDFWASWCAPCKLMVPALNEIAEDEENEITVGKVNVEQQKILAKKYKIRSLPTLLIFKDGQEVSRLSGVKSKKAILKEIRRVS